MEFEDDEESCGCKGGVSPRMRYILKVAAELALDMAPDMCDPDHDGFYGSEYIPHTIVPSGKHNYEKRLSFVYGLSAIFEIMVSLLKQDKIPHVIAVEEELADLAESRNKKFAYGTLSDVKYFFKCGGDVEMACQVVVDGGKFNGRRATCRRRWRTLMTKLTGSSRNARSTTLTGGWSVMLFWASGVHHLLLVRTGAGESTATSAMTYL